MYGGSAAGSGRRVRVALLAATLLVCHGLLGASHLLAHEGYPMAPAADGRPHETGHQTTMGALSGAHHAAGHAPDEDGPAVGTAEYFAVLLALAGTALLAALFGLGRTTPASPARPAPPLRGTPASNILSRGPSPPFLQVFRL